MRLQVIGTTHNTLNTPPISCKIKRHITYKTVSSHISITHRGVPSYWMSSLMAFCELLSTLMPQSSAISSVRHTATMNEAELKFICWLCRALCLNCLTFFEARLDQLHGWSAHGNVPLTINTTFLTQHDFVMIGCKSAVSAMLAHVHCRLLRDTLVYTKDMCVLTIEFCFREIASITERLARLPLRLRQIRAFMPHWLWLDAHAHKICSDIPLHE